MGRQLRDAARWPLTMPRFGLLLLGESVLSKASPRGQ